MFKDIGNLGQVMKLQKKMKSIQKTLKKKETTAESSDGSVKATVNGEFLLQDIIINDALLQSNDKKKIENMIISAVNNAVNGSKSAAAEEMSALTGGLNVPGLDELFK